MNRAAGESIEGPFTRCDSYRHYAPAADALESGLRYCERLAIWAWPSEGGECRFHEEESDHEATA